MSACYPQPGFASKAQQPRARREFNPAVSSSQGYATTLSVADSCALVNRNAFAWGLVGHTIPRETTDAKSKNKKPKEEISVQGNQENKCMIIHH